MKYFITGALITTSMLFAHTASAQEKTCNSIGSCKQQMLCNTRPECALRSIGH